MKYRYRYICFLFFFGPPDESSLRSYTTRLGCPSVSVPQRLLELEIDTPVANLAAKVGQAAAATVSSEAKASVEVLLDSIRASRMWPTFTKMLGESGVRPFVVLHL